MTQVTIASIAYVATQVSYHISTSASSKPNASARSDLHYRLLQHSLGQIPSPIQNVSTIAFFNFLRMQTRRMRWMLYSSGGTGKLQAIFPKKVSCGSISQIFPTYSSARRPVTKNSALAKLKEKRAALKARNQS
jgi:hypothetical protein